MERLPAAWRGLSGRQRRVISPEPLPLPMMAKS